MIDRIPALALVFATLAVFGCSQGGALPNAVGSESSAAEAAEIPEHLDSAVFAGGCFWCMEPPYDRLEGVISTTSGYAGGPEEDPTYEQVSAGRTGHAEVVRVVYDPEVVSYEELLHVFWRNVDPTVEDRQFCDSGSQYRTGIFPQGEEQERAARESLEELRRTKPFDAPIVTGIHPLEAFYPAEEYHQDFYEKNPIRYETYRRGCRRDARLEELWGDEAGGH